ncbi:MAG: salicylate hydroxylase [Ramlibacter sp.]|nr:salicylate hydroxylase [Ramlibacter sp.]
MSSTSLPVLVAGGGIGGLAAALALVRRGFQVQVFEQAAEIGEIGAGIQLGPNAFAACDALGVGDKLRAKAVYTDYLVMHDALDESVVCRIETGDAFLQRFGNPYAVIHRVDIHRALYDGAVDTGRVEFFANTRIEHVEQDEGRRTVTVTDQNGKSWTGQALIGADGVKSVVRARYVNDPAKVTGHVVYRSVVDESEFPADLKWNASAIWVGPSCHLVHYPLRAGKQYNVVVTFHSRQPEEWGVTEGSKEEVESYFQGISPRARQLIDLPKSWRRWATADKDPIATWVFGRATILGDSAHPTTQYMAQGGCMALEDAVTLGEALRVSDNDWDRALPLYQRNRVTRTARIVLSAREMGRLFHVQGVERLVRNSLWKGRSQERYYDALEWLYGWSAANCLAQG